MLLLQTSWYLTLCQTATPDAAWSQEVLHNAAQDLVKGFLCVFTNSSAAGASDAGGGHQKSFLLLQVDRSIRQRLESANNQPIYQSAAQILKQLNGFFFLLNKSIRTTLSIYERLYILSQFIKIDNKPWFYLLFYYYLLSTLISRWMNSQQIWSEDTTRRIEFMCRNIKTDYPLLMQTD